MHSKTLITCLFSVVFAVGCGNPIENCDALGSDCCKKDTQCIDYYGAEFPRCLIPPGANEGTCSECVDNYDCPTDYYCDTEDDFGICLEIL